MLAINTINDFFSLNPFQQKDVLNGVRVVERLNTFLVGRNNKKQAEAISAPCKSCHGTGTFTKEVRVDTDLDYHASSISACARKLWFDTNGYRDKAENKNNGNNIRTLDLGNAVHDLIQSYGKEGAFCAPENYQDEVPIEPDRRKAIEKGLHDLPLAQEFSIRSHVDAIVWGVPVEVRGLGTVMVRVVHEYKTIGEKGFNFLTGPKDEHRRQVAMYAMAFDIPITVFIYWCIANQELKEFPMAINFSDWQYVENKIKQNEEYKTKGEPPPFELSAAKLNNIECAGDGNRYGPCKYYGVVCNPPPELLNIGARKRGK